jgi:hypothetical protein
VNKIQHNARLQLLRISMRGLFASALFFALLLACGAWPGHDGKTLAISQAHADDDDDGDDGGSTGGGSTGGGSTGGGSTSGGSTGGGTSGSESSGGEGTTPATRNANFFSWLFGGNDREPQEILALDLSTTALNALRAEGFTLVGQQTLRLNGSRVSRLRAPDRMNLNTALQRVRAVQPNVTADFNHLYRPSSAACLDKAGCVPQLRPMLGWPESASCQAAQSLIGVIDTAVDTQHPSLNGQRLQVLRSVSGDRKPSGTGHGTAVVALLIGKSGSDTPGLVPRAQVIAVDAFYRTPRGQDTMNAYDFAAALDALVARNVRVINLSFAGPPNLVIEEAITRATGRGVSIVASVGNDGPSSKPMFPAAYPNVVAVTAVNHQQHVFRRAVQGSHVTVSAPGVDIWTAAAADQTGGMGAQSGTSMAAPFVTAAIATLKSQPKQRISNIRPETVRQALLSRVKDLGEPGHDPVFGHGLLQMDAWCNPARPKAEGSTLIPVAAKNSAIKSVTYSSKIPR